MHTPGPWKLDDQFSPLVYGQTGPYIAQVFGYDSGDTGSRRASAEADARLIAAAPDLLTALQSLIDGVIRHEVREDYHKHYPEIARARAAISKATGA